MAVNTGIGAGRRLRLWTLAALAAAAAALLPLLAMLVMAAEAEGEPVVRRAVSLSKSSGPAHDAHPADAAGSGHIQRTETDR